MTRHELVGEHGCSCGLVASDFSALCIHLIRANGGQFIVSEVIERDSSGDDAPTISASSEKPDITGHRA